MGSSTPSATEHAAVRRLVKLREMTPEEPCQFRVGSAQSGCLPLRGPGSILTSRLPVIHLAKLTPAAVRPATRGSQRG